MKPEKKESSKIKIRKIIGKVRGILDEKKGEDIVTLDLKGLSTVTDYFIICTATSPKHSRTIVEHVLAVLKKNEIRPYNVDGLPEGMWVVMDYIEFMVHIFIGETRELYALEKLWGDAKRVE